MYALKFRYPNSGYYDITLYIGKKKVLHIHFLQCIPLIKLRSVVYQMIFLGTTTHLLMTVVSKSNSINDCSLYYK